MKLFIAALVIGSSVSAFANTPAVGVLENVKGVVSVSSNGVVTNVVTNASLTNGSVVVNSSNGTSLVRLTNGCTVGLKSSQVLTVNATAKCSDLIASVKSIETPVVLADDDKGGIFTQENLLIAGGLIAGGLLIREVTKTSASGK